MIIDLSDYPLERSNKVCRGYMNCVDWERVYEVVRANHVTYFGASDAMLIFGHLKLDEEYALYCYVSHEYHGLWGRVAAVKKAESVEPQNVTAKDPSRPLLGVGFELPDSSVPPMEAIYHDGTPHGYFEALLAEEFFHALPYVRFEQERWDNCVVRHPEGFYSDWDIYEDIADWHPRMITTPNNDVIVSMCWQHFENGIGASDGCDTIRRSQHHFEKDLVFHHFFERQKNKSSMYKAQIDDNKRYRDGHHCCVATERSIIIAKQKDWETRRRQEEHVLDSSDATVRL